MAPKATSRTTRASKPRRRPAPTRNPTSVLRTKPRGEGDARFQAIYENAATAIGITDLSGTFEHCNPAFCAMIGYSEAQLRRLRFRSLIHPDDRAANLVEVRKLLDGEIPSFVIENRYVHRDGRPIWVRKFVSTLPDSAGRPAHLLALATDISERRQTEDALRAGEARLRFALRAAGGGAWDWDLTRDDAWWSDEMFELWGIAPRARVSTAAAIESIVPQDQERLRACIADALARRSDLHCEFRVRHPTLGERWMATFGRPVADAGGEPARMLGITLDVHARKHAEAEARESERRLQAFLENSAVVAWMKDEAGRYVFLNRILQERLGVHFPDWVGKTDLDLFPPEIAEPFRRHDQAVIEAQQAIEVVEESPAPDGGITTWLTNKFPFHAEDGTRFVGGLAVDISERVRAEASLRDREAQLRAVLDAATDAIVTVEPDGTIDSVNPATERLFGYGAAELLGRNLSLLLAERFPRGGAAAPMPRGGAREIVGRRKDGSPVPIALTTASMREHHTFVANLHDLSRRKALESEVLEISALEQGRIGQELHDELGQELTGIGMLSSALAKRLAGREEGELAAKLVASLGRARKTVRALAHGLVPMRVEPQTFGDALASLVDRVRDQSGVDCTFEGAPAAIVADGIAATHLFNIAREALHNAIRHADAKHVRVTLWHEDGAVTLIVADDGRGLPPDAGESAGGLGLRLMRNRAGLIGARLTLQSERGKGTRVACTLATAASGG